MSDNPAFLLYVEQIDASPRVGDHIMDRRKRKVDVEIPIDVARQLIKDLQQCMMEGAIGAIRIRLIGRT